jgi:hypothetical protein
MRRLLVLAALFAAPLLVLPILLAGPAHADESPSVERLTAAEIDHLRRHVPAWDDLPEERRERIAKNVLRLRNLSPEERSRLQGRLERFQREGEEGRDRLPERLSKLHGRPRDQFRLHARLASALGPAVLAELPEDVRAALAAPGSHGGRPRAAVLGFLFLRGILARTAEELGASGGHLAYEPSPEAAAAYAARKARFEAATPDAREREGRALAWLVAEDRVRRALAGVEGPRTAQALRAAAPEAYDAVLADLVARARRSPDELRRSLQQPGGRPGPEGPRSERLRTGALLLIRFLEQSSAWLASDPEARERADRLLERVLVHGLEVPAPQWERLPGWDRPVDRLRALRRLVVR